MQMQTFLDTQYIEVETLAPKVNPAGKKRKLTRITIDDQKESNIGEKKQPSGMVCCLALHQLDILRPLISCVDQSQGRAE